MSISMYDFAIAPMARMLTQLDRILAKGEEHAREHSIKPEVLVQARLYPNMLPLVAQIRIATDTAKGAAARLSGAEVPKWADDEHSFADLHARVDKALDYLGTFSARQFEGAASRDIRMKVGSRELEFTGADYVTHFVMPNFYFHVTTAYNILRHNGVALGKADYLGG